MPKWEYAFLIVKHSYNEQGWQSAYIFTGPDRKKIKMEIPVDRDATDDVDTRDIVALNKLGEYQWELVQTQIWSAGIFNERLETGAPYRAAAPTNRIFW